MSVATLERLPDLVHYAILTLLNEESPKSVCAFALASRSCHDAASPFLYRQLIVKSNTREHLGQVVQHHMNGPLSSFRMSYVRILRFQGSMPPATKENRQQDSPSATEENGKDSTQDNEQPLQDKMKLTGAHDKPHESEGSSKDSVAELPNPYYMPDGKLFLVRGPAHVHGYANLSTLAPPTPLDHRGKVMEPTFQGWKYSIRSRAGEDNAEDHPFIKFLSALKHLRSFIWDSEAQLPQCVLQALQRFHPSASLSFGSLRFLSAWKMQTAPSELALASSPLVHEVAAQIVDFHVHEDPSGPATIRLLRTLPNIRALHFHVISGSPYHYPGRKGTQRGNDRIQWDDFHPPLPDTGLARLETLTLSAGSSFDGKGMILSAFQKIKNSIDFTSLKALYLTVLSTDIFETLTVEKVMPNLQHLGIELVENGFLYARQAGQLVEKHTTSSIQRFMMSLPPLRQLEIHGAIVDQEIILISPAQSSSTLRMLVCQSAIETTRFIDHVTTQFPFLERVSLRIRGNTRDVDHQMAEALARLPYLRFCELSTSWQVCSDDHVKLVWDKMFEAQGIYTSGRQKLMGLRLNYGPHAVVVTRSERDDIGPRDIRIVRFEHSYYASHY